MEEQSIIRFLDLQKVTALHEVEIQETVQRIVHSGWYLHGEATREFEWAYARFLGVKQVVSCANGLDALTLILRAYCEMGILHEGDEVLVPAHTFIASILAITENKLKAVLVEPRWNTLELDEEDLTAKLTSRTKALLLVHLYGRCTYTTRLEHFCKEHQLLVIEDNAQAHGCRFGDKRTGSLGDAAGHSFYPGKNLGALGDGGAVSTNNEELATVVRSLANYGSTDRYVFQYRGRNSRLDELQAAVLTVKLRYLDEDNAHRARCAELYQKGLCSPLVNLPSITPVEGNVYHLFPVFCEQRDALKAFLLHAGIETQIHYPIPPHRQNCYKEWSHLSLPVTERIHREELSLPISPALTEEEVKRVIEVINRFRGDISECIQ